MHQETRQSPDLNQTAQAQPRSNTSLTALILANAVTLFGVMFFGWRAAEVLLLYWFESVVVGFYTLARIATSTDRSPGPAKLFMIPFFCVHYGVFMFVHLMFLAIILGASGSIMDPRESPFDRAGILVDQLAGIGYLIGILALFASHGVSFVVNFLQDSEARSAGIQRIMGRPYKRIVAMHMAIVLGGFVTVMLAQPLVLVLLLVVIKTVIDARSHLRERGQTRADPRQKSSGR